MTEHYGLEVADRRVARNHQDVLVRSRRVEFTEMLGMLTRHELKGVCQALGLDALAARSGR